MPRHDSETVANPTVTIDDVRTAHTRIVGDVVRTPLLAAPWADGDLWLKAESLQPIGAFKLRGALHAVGRLDPVARRRGVVTHSSGNHGQALAWAARTMSVPAVVVMPDNAATVKVAAIEALGAEVVRTPVGTRESTADAVRAERGSTLIPPFDHADVIAGQGTVALELLDELRDVDTVLVPVGGGGLISGIGVVVAALAPHTRLIGVEPELAADARDSLTSGRRVEWDTQLVNRTLADGTRTPVVGEVTFPVMRATVDEIVTVSEEAIVAAAGTLARRARLVAEPSGALSVAAYLASPARYGRTVAIVSGGNVDPATLTRALGEGAVSTPC